MSLWCVTCFFNPCRHNSYVEKFNAFHSRLKKQNAKLLTVELVFGEEKFQLGHLKHDSYIQLKTNDIIWQKESLLNIGFNKLPSECDKVVWIDSDIIFEDDDWQENTQSLLDKHQIAQLFSSIEETDGSETSFGIIKNLKGLPGGVWAARRECLKYGLYDRMIVGGGDRVFAHAVIVPNKVEMRYVEKNPIALTAMETEWFKKTKDLIKDYSYLDVTIKHVSHGNKKNRKYGNRNKQLAKFNYDPENDVRLNGKGLLVWNTNKPKLHHYVKNYFIRRKDG